MLRHSVLCLYNEKWECDNGLENRRRKGACGQAKDRRSYSPLEKGVGGLIKTNCENVVMSQKTEDRRRKAPHP